MTGGGRAKRCFRVSLRQTICPVQTANNNSAIPNSHSTEIHRRTENTRRDKTHEMPESRWWQIERVRRRGSDGDRSGGTVQVSVSRDALVNN